MARTTKTGLDYFSHDVDMMQDKKIKLIKAKHGLIGYAVFLRMLEELYREGGYYIKVDEEFNILFSDDNNISYDVYILILNDCINYELFNIDMYERHSILTSERIQKNYAEATKRRKVTTYIKEYLLIDPMPFYDPSKYDVNINPLNVNINPLNESDGTQRKGKERKEKNIIPYQQIADEYHSICVDLPSIRTLTDGRKKAIKSFLKDNTLEDLTELFTKTQNSDFLTGRSDRQWTGCGFDWILKPANRQKILEGNYDNNGQPSKVIKPREFIDCRVEVE